MAAFDWSRRGLVAGAGALWAGGAFAQDGKQAGAASVPFAAPSSPQTPSDQETLKGVLDQTHRLTTDVYINGQGPFAFLVDTGADHSVVSAEVAAALGLPVGPPILVHGVAGDLLAPSTLVAELKVGSRGLQNVTLPLLTQGNMGAAGVLGIDAVQDQRVALDFKGNRIIVSNSPRRRAAFDEVIVRARSRFGQLVLVDSSLDDHPILVVIDTGAESSIANSAFRQRIGERESDRTHELTAIYSVTGQSTTGNWSMIPTVQIGGFKMSHLPVVFSDLRSFDRWGLQKQPTLLLGMDVLRLFDMVEIDFARREVRFAGLHASDAIPDRSPWRLARDRAHPPQA